MFTKRLLLLIIILTFFSSISALQVLTTTLAATRTIDITNTTNTGHTHLQSRHESNASTSYTADGIIERAATLIHPHPPHLSKSSNLIPRIYQTPPAPPETHEAPPASTTKQINSTQSTTDPKSNTSNTSPDAEDPGKKWYEAEWVNGAAWAIWLYVVGSVLGLLTLWGKGRIDRRGEWSIASPARTPGGRETGRGGGVRGRRRTGEWRRLERGGLERMRF